MYELYLPFDVTTGSAKKIQARISTGNINHLFYSKHEDSRLIKSIEKTIRTEESPYSSNFSLIHAQKYTY